MNSEKSYPEFKNTVWEYYAQHKRRLPWRTPEVYGTFDSYKILVSEVMLQQTQVDRVQPKYELFLKEFPDIQSLADARFDQVLRVWSGLGYSRRAKYLHDFAKENTKNHFPETVESLTKFKGIGHNTASAVLVYSYNEPLAFIETNIRTVFLHHFFDESPAVSDREILSIVDETLERSNPREWYWALMDYDSFLKKSGIKNLHKSSQYKKQSKFEGSKRQIRGEVLRLLLKNGTMDKAQLRIEINDSRFDEVLESLKTDKLIQVKNGAVLLT